MRNYIPSLSEPSGHDQFFATFGKYGEVSWRVTGEMTALLLRRYAAERVQHTELMITLTPQSRTDEGAAREIKAHRPRRQARGAQGLHRAGRAERERNIDAWQAATRKELGCDTGTPEPGCNVTYRYIAQVNRNSDEARVFANTALAAALVRADPRVAGLNFVGPEDYRVARTDYRDHMKTIGFLTKDASPSRCMRANCGSGWCRRTISPSTSATRSRPRARSASAMASRSPTRAAASSCSTR